MKKILLIIFFATSQLSTIYAAKLTVQLTDAMPNQKVYLGKATGLASYIVDSALISNGIAVFNRKSTFDRGFYTITITDNKSLTLILSNEDILVSGSIKTFPQGSKIDNSVENTVYSQLMTYLQNHRKVADPIESKRQQAMANPEASAVYARQSDSLAQVLSAYYRNVAKQYPNTFIGKVALFLAEPQNPTADNYFDAKMLADDELANGELLLMKTNTYLQRFPIYSLDEFRKRGDEIAALCKPQSAMRETAYQSLAMLVVQADAATAHYYADRYVKEYGSEKAISFKASLPKLPLGPGVVAPDIELENPDGLPIKLSSLRGKYVLIDFWASWCRPCRMENPNVVRTYEKYKDKGFTVYSVSLDNKRENWLNAINADNLTWPNHVSDLKGWRSSAAALYSVNSIPSTFLIGPDGMIIDKNLRGGQLETKLEQLLK